jgi:mRNA-degrading endonuclease toxin of MazEF toxin-antitoxin module
MPTSGDVVDVDLGAPAGSEAGFRHPAVVVTAQRILNGSSSDAHIALITVARKLVRRCYHTLRNAGESAFAAAA